MPRQKDLPPQELLPILPPPREAPAKPKLPERNGPGMHKDLVASRVGDISARFSKEDRDAGENAHRNGTFWRELWVNRAELLYVDEVPEKDTQQNFLEWASKASGIPPGTIRSDMDFAATATAAQAGLGKRKCMAGHVIAWFLGLTFEELSDDRKVEKVIGRPLRFRTATVKELEAIAKKLAEPPALPPEKEPTGTKARRYKTALAKTQGSNPAIDELKPKVRTYRGEVVMQHDYAVTEDQIEALAVLYAHMRQR